MIYFSNELLMNLESILGLRKKKYRVTVLSRSLENGMTYGKTKVLTSFAFFGFILGTVAYFVFKWFVTNDLIHINFPSISSLVMSPWFISGSIGALLSTLIVIIFSRLTR